MAIPVAEADTAVMVMTVAQVTKITEKEETTTVLVMGNKDQTVGEVITVLLVMGLTIIVINKGEVILVITPGLTIRMENKEVLIVDQTTGLVIPNVQTTTKIKMVLSALIQDTTKIVENAHHIIKVMVNKDKVVETTTVLTGMGLTATVINKVLDLTVIMEKEGVIAITILLVIATVLTITASITTDQIITLTLMLKIKMLKLKLNSLLKNHVIVNVVFLTLI